MAMVEGRAVVQQIGGPRVNRIMILSCPEPGCEGNFKERYERQAQEFEAREKQMVTFGAVQYKYGSDPGKLYKAFFDEMTEEERDVVLGSVCQYHLAVFATLRTLDRDSFKKVYGVDA